MFVNRYIQLEQVGEHIERYFTRYMDVNIAAPYRTRLLGSVEIRKKLEVVYTRLMEGETDKKLFKILQLPLAKLSDISQESRFTYRSLIYHKKLLNELHNNFLDNDTIEEHQLIDILYRLNFNSVEFFNYLTTRIEKEMEELMGIDRIGLLYQYKKIYAQKVVLTNMIYQPTLPSIREQVFNWIGEEVVYQEKIAKPETGVQQSSPMEVDKITTDLSVAQLAYSGTTSLLI